MRLKIATLAVALVAALLTPSAVQAAPIGLQLSDGTNTVVVFDGGAGDLSPLAGVITFTGPVGAWIINVTTGIGSQTGISPDFMDLNSVNVATATTTTLSVMFTQPDNTVAFPGFTLTFGGTSNNATVIAAAFFDNTNGYFGGTQFASLGPFGPGAFAGTTAGGTGTTSPYSLTQAFFITGNGNAAGSSFSGNASLNPVPEPGSLMLLGGGLLGLAGLARRRRQKKAQQ